jgi:hypothetical protein
MSASANTKKQCVTCHKSGGILICDGCQQIFCGKHVIEHRQNLAGQLDGIMQEHDLLQHEIERISMDHSSLQKINEWEKQFIAKIHLAAKTARKNLQKTLDQSKERLSKICRDTAVDLRSSREADDYSENDLIGWTEKLKTLKLEMTSASLVKIIEDKNSVIHLIKIESNESNNNEPVNNDKQSSLSTSSSKLKIQEKFSDVVGPITLKNGGYIAKHTSCAWNYGYIHGNLLYSHGCHTTRFKLEKCHLPYCIFFGCTSYQTALTEDIFRSSSAIGWFGSNQVYEHGRCSSNSKKYNYNTYLIQINDVLRITFDCDKQQIKLFNERLNRISTLKVNINKTPYPWRLLMVMLHGGDCVRILTDI